LSSLWDSQPQPQQAQDPQSLRQGRGAPSRLGAGAGAQRHNPFARQQSSQEPQVQARPLPSQRAGSYQAVGASAYGRGGNETPPGSSGGMTASERLRDKFNKTGRVASPVSNASPAAPKMADTVREVVRQNSYGSSASGGGSGNYEDRFMPQDGGYGRRGGGDKPFVAATAPWASNEAEFTGSGYGGSSGARQGLPSGPGVGRKGPGLPSGPRGPR
jgi:hypothetical protein